MRSVAPTDGAPGATAPTADAPPAARPIRSLVLAPFFDLHFVNNRPRTVAEVLGTFGPVDVVTTDFDHALKARKPRDPWHGARRLDYLPTPAYARNVSPSRFWSHVAFSRRALALVRARRGEYDLVYATAPFNLLAAGAFSEAAGALRVLDVVDIWPDVLPFPAALRRAARPAFAAWKALFTAACRRADVLMAVSDLFLAEARESFRGGDAAARRVYIGHPSVGAGSEPVGPAPAAPFRLAYVGNIGRLYDFETLLDACEAPALRGRIELQVIGRGDREGWLRGELERRGIAHAWLGVVTRREALAAALGGCHAGFNGYANTTAAFSYKATTYLAAGLPLVNSMSGDLRRLVEERGLGANYRAGDASSLAGALTALAGADLTAMRARCASFFAVEIDADVVRRRIREFLAERIAAAGVRAAA